MKHLLIFLFLLTTTIHTSNAQTLKLKVTEERTYHEGRYKIQAARYRLHITKEAITYHYKGAASHSIPVLSMTGSGTGAIFDYRAYFLLPNDQVLIWSIDHGVIFRYDLITDELWELYAFDIRGGYQFQKKHSEHLIQHPHTIEVRKELIQLFKR
jgi:hypothetical protein